MCCIRIRIFQAAAIAGLVCLCSAANAEPMPQIAGSSLNGKQIQLPNASKGHPAVILLGFSHDSQTQMKQWGVRLRTQFSGSPDVEVYSIVVLEDAPRLIRGMIVHSMKSSVPADQHDRFLTVVQGEADLKRAAKFEKANEAYLLLLDVNGEIQWRTHGEATDRASSDLTDHFKALKPQ